ncbi:MAG: hypothetical protein HUU47_03030 [Bacteroidetes bacterium]|nr:hypothetical protein [Bacteroidota bacterium]
MNDKWRLIQENIKIKFNKKPDLNAVLFLIGIRELGTLQNKFSKEEKTELIHIAVCKVLSYSGYYKFQKNDERGWPIWKLEKKIPVNGNKEQEILIKNHVIEYFERENIF